MTFQIMGTEHLGQARCVCETSSKGQDGCPLHQVPVRVATIATACRDIDTLVAENAALRAELDALLDTEVGEVRAHNDELMSTNGQLRAQVRSLQAEVSRLGGGMR